MLERSAACSRRSRRPGRGDGGGDRPDCRAGRGEVEGLAELGLAGTQGEEAERQGSERERERQVDDELGDRDAPAHERARIEREPRFAPPPNARAASSATDRDEQQDGRSAHAEEWGTRQAYVAAAELPPTAGAAVASPEPGDTTRAAPTVVVDALRRRAWKADTWRQP